MLGGFASAVALAVVALVMMAESVHRMWRPQPISFNEAIKKTIESADDNRIADIHVWRVGPADYAAIISIVTHYPQNSDHYKKMLADFSKLSHITMEIHGCTSEPCIVPNQQTP